MTIPQSQDQATPAVDAARLLVARATEDLGATRHALLATQAVVELLLDVAAPLAVVEGGVVRGWSRALEELTGVTARDAIGRPTDGDLLGPGGWPDADGTVWTATVHRRGDLELHVFAAAA